MKLINRCLPLLLLPFLCGNIYGQNFTIVDKLMQAERIAGNQFGFSTAYSGDFAAVSAPRENIQSGENTLNDAGSVTIFKKNASGDFEFHQKIDSKNLVADALFGHSIALHNDILAIGSPRDNFDEDELNPVSRAGSIFIYIRNPNTDLFEFSQKIASPEREQNMEFGLAVDLFGDHLVTGTPFVSTGLDGQPIISRAGAVFLYSIASAGLFQFTQKIVSEERGTNRRFGTSVSIHGNVVAVGEPNADIQKGRVYVFELNSSGTLEYTFTIAPEVLNNGDQLGLTVFVNDDALLAGAPYHISDNGAAFFYERNQDKTWSLIQRLRAEDTTASVRFGDYHVELNDDTAVIGSHMLSGQGRLYIFKKNPDEGTLNTDPWEEAGFLISPDRGGPFGNSFSIINSERILIGSPGDFGSSDGSFDTETGQNTGAVFIAKSDGSVNIGNEGSELPLKVTLRQNHPNPFNPATTIVFELPEPADVSLEVFNIAGQRMAVLVDGPKNAGQHSASFDASRLPSGVYLYRLTAGNIVQTRKMILVK